MRGRIVISSIRDRGRHYVAAGVDRARLTASLHWARCFVRSTALISGENVFWILSIFAALSGAHRPAPTPASIAAPRPVDSISVGRSTVTPATSAWNCISKSFAAAPPSTRSRASGRRASSAIAAKRSCTSSAIPSSDRTGKAQFGSKGSRRVSRKAQG